ncbi:MAG: DUF86 domain-containing protein [Deltaproteobacteria bacterium]|nr:DUF86 domain-containing protein [Deltaproteobacteria bacterium]
MYKVNIDKIGTLTGEIKTALKSLESYSLLSEKEAVDNPTVLGSIKYNLIVAIQGCIDIGSHIVAKEYARAPEDYGDCFKVLKEVKVIDEPLSGKLVKMARFRNLLVHLYWEVDNRRVYEIIRNDLADIEDFLKKIGHYLKKKESKP